MDSLRCQYASKPCEQPRSFKENGDLHRLCVYHRARANDAQRRWHLRQRTTSDGAGVADTTDDHVSERTKRRRRAAQAAREVSLLGGGVGARRRPVRARQAKQKTLVAAPPTSPPSVDSATFTAMLHTPLVPEPQATMVYVVGSDERLSDEDLALLDELMLCMDETQPVASAISAHQQERRDFSAGAVWSPVHSAFSGSASYFV